MLIRQAHLYLGMLIAPSILMFAFSGAIQIFRLHEAHPGYKPPALIERLGRLHKDQVFAAAPARRAAAADTHDADHGPALGDPQQPTPSVSTTPRASGGKNVRTTEAPAPGRAGPTLSKQLLQWFFTLVAVGLIISTALGIWMGAMQSRWKVTARWLLLAGIAIPVVLLFV